MQRTTKTTPVAGMLAAALVLAIAVAAGAAQAQTGFNRPIKPNVPLTGPLTPVPPTAGTHIPRFKPNCRWQTQRYYHPVEGWIARRVEVCR